MKFSKLFIWGLAVVAAASFACCGGGDDNGGEVDCGTDTLCQQCEDSGGGPWCYEEALVTEEDDSRCAKITDYWGDSAIGVEGQCFYDIMRATGDCSLCSQIEKDDLRTMCNNDCP